MIGVIDFGLGGLTVVDALLNCLPEQDLVYLGDTACLPGYSPRPEKVAAWTAESAARLERWGATVLVLASHTISCLAFDASSVRFRIPVVDVTVSAAHQAAAVSRRLCIGVVGSREVVERARHAELLRERIPAVEVVAAACPLWAPLVAEGWGKRRETAMVVKRDLRPIRLRQVDVLILGSSYFIPLRRVVQRKMGQQVILVDPSQEVARRVAARLQEHGAGPSRPNGSRRVRLLVSELTPHVQRAAQAVLGHSAAIEAAG